MVRRRPEDGNATLQFLFAVVFLMTLLFSGIQIGGMMLSANRLGTDLTRATYKVDAGGLMLASDKEAFVHDQIIAIGSELSSENLSVSDVRVTASNASSAGAVGAGAGGLTEISQDTVSIEVSFDVSYAIPSIVDMPGLSGQTLSRHVEFVRVGETTIEVR